LEEIHATAQAGKISADDERNSLVRAARRGEAEPQGTPGNSLLLPR